MNNIIKEFEDINNLNVEEIYPNIFVYHDMLSDPQKTYNVLLNSEKENLEDGYFSKWTDWSVFGTYTKDSNKENVDNLKNKEKFLLEKSISDEIYLSYSKAINHYFKKTNIKIPENASLTDNSYCKYADSINVLKNNMTMQYHTDYIISEKDMPGPKFHTTCTFYINDDYNGGEIEFYVDNNFITYKPKAGDILIFPSTEPYWHGVKTINSGNKFFIRSFIMFPFDGTEEWLKNQKEHGAYRWAQLEIDRCEKENKNNMLYIKDGKIVSHEDMYAENKEL